MFIVCSPECDTSRRTFFTPMKRFEFQLRRLLLSEPFSHKTWEGYYATLTANSWKDPLTGRIFSLSERSVATILAEAEEAKREHVPLPKASFFTNHPLDDEDRSIRARAWSRWYQCATDKNASPCLQRRIQERCSVEAVPW